MMPPGTHRVGNLLLTLHWSLYRSIRNGGVELKARNSSLRLPKEQNRTHQPLFRSLNGHTNTLLLLNTSTSLLPIPLISAAYRRQHSFYPNHHPSWRVSTTVRVKGPVLFYACNDLFKTRLQGYRPFDYSCHRRSQS